MKVKRLLFFFMAICLASGVRAQIYNSGVLFFHFYEREGDCLSPITNPNAIIMILRVRNGSLEMQRTTVEKVVNNLKRNINYYESATFEKIPRNYDSQMSNSKWDVWSLTINKPQSFYHALKKDFSEYTEWCEPDVFWIDGEERPLGRAIYKGYTKEQLLKITFGGRRDFLN